MTRGKSCRKCIKLFLMWFFFFAECITTRWRAHANIFLYLQFYGEYSKNTGAVHFYLVRRETVNTQTHFYNLLTLTATNMAPMRNFQFIVDKMCFVCPYTLHKPLLLYKTQYNNNNNNNRVLDLSEKKHRVFNLKVESILIWVNYLLRFTTCYIAQLNSI